MLTLVFFITKRSFPPNKNRNFYKFFYTKTEVSTVKYHFRYKVLFVDDKTSFSVLTLVFFITKRSFPPNKNRNFYKFFYTKTEVSTVKYHFRYKVLFVDDKTSFSVLTLVFFITKWSFQPNKNRNFYNFFSTKTEVSTVKYYFRYKVLF